MHSMQHILAESDSGAMKVIFGVIFVLIWFATSAMSALAKKKTPPQAPRKPPVIAPRRPAPPARRSVPMISKPNPTAAKVQPPPIVAAPAAAFVPSSITRLRTSGAGPTLAHAAPRADALRLLLRPQTLQQQFLLTEILQPPLSLRSER